MTHLPRVREQLLDATPHLNHWDSDDGWQARLVGKGNPIHFSKKIRGANLQRAARCFGTGVVYARKAHLHRPPHLLKARNPSAFTASTSRMCARTRVVKLL